MPEPGSLFNLFQPEILILGSLFFWNSLKGLVREILFMGIFFLTQRCRDAKVLNFFFEPFRFSFRVG